MNIRIHSFSIERHDISTRMPFKYGIATMTHLPHIFLRVEASFAGKIVKGISADHLPPKWFTKDPTRDPLDEIDEMLRVIEKAGEHAKSIASETVFDFWSQLYKRQAAWSADENLPPLLAHFGTSLVERALIDAFCRFQQKPFSELLQENAFGIDWGELRPELSGFEPKDLLPPPLSTLIVRHTVGLADYLYEDEIPSEERVEDGLPQALESCIQFYGSKHLKIKVNGNFDQDIKRLRAISDLLSKLEIKEYGFTLDGNEQFHDVGSFREAWNAWQADESLEQFFGHLIFVEQPFHRSIALSDAIGDSLKTWKDAPPIIIDESDATLDSMPHALELGYRGTSHKNCKGVFKGIINRAAINHKNREAGEERYLMSGEDLSNIGPIASHQDLVVQACLGNASVERNGHHYFRGLSVFDASLQETVLAGFPQLYLKDAGGYARLNTRQGELNVKPVTDYLFGTNVQP